MYPFSKRIHFDDDDDENSYLSSGGFFSSLFSNLFGTREMRILILGLDGAGKTTILYRLQVGEVVTTIPSKCQLVLLIQYFPFILTAEFNMVYFYVLSVSQYLFVD